MQILVPELNYSLNIRDTLAIKPEITGHVHPTASREGTMKYKDNSVLLVDDDQAVLDAMETLLSPLGCRVFLTTSPIQALEMLQIQPVDIVISDIHLPEMEGECFLEKVSETFPEIERIVMSGHSETQATIDAINRGKVSRFMLKPWDDDQVIKVVSDSFELATMKAENKRLQEETERKNTELVALNDSLEAKVQDRTQQLKLTNDRLKGSYRSVVRMFSTLTARRMGVKVSGLNLQLNQLLIGIAKSSGIEGVELKQLYYAWQLRNIGKLSFSDQLIKAPYLQMSPKQQREFHQHPILAQAACMMVQPLYQSGKLILQYKEYMDGSGYPRGLSAEKIDIRAQVICVMNDYVELTTGLFDERHYSTTEAIGYLQDTAPERYNQEIVVALQELIKLFAQKGKSISDSCIQSIDLKTDMKLSRDLISESGILLLSAEQALDETAIERIREMEFNLNETFSIYVSTHV